MGGGSPRFPREPAGKHRECCASARGAGQARGAATRPPGDGGEVLPAVPSRPLLRPAGVSGAGDPVPQPPAALQPVPPEVHAGGRAGARGGERSHVSFALCASWCSVHPAAASQLKAAAPALPLPLAPARSASRSTRRHKGHWAYLMGQSPYGQAQVQTLLISILVTSWLSYSALASHAHYLSCGCCSVGGCDHEDSISFRHLSLLS